MRKNKMLRRTLSVFMASVLLTATGAPALAASFKAKVNSSSARVYNIPSKSDSVSLRAVKGVTVTVTAYAKGWARISYKGKTAYMPVKYLNLTDPVKMYTNRSSAVYASDSSSSKRLGTLGMGKAVYGIGVSGDYARVQNASGSITGYIKLDNLSTKSEMIAAYKAWKAAQEAEQDKNDDKNDSGASSGGSSENTLANRIGKVITLAGSLLGHPYALSDNPPSSFNCSSFVEYCMEKQGFSMEGTAAKQAADGSYAAIRDVSDIRVGDVLCFDTDEDGVCDHTAIYLGDNRFIEASSNAGKVQTNELTSWYKQHFMLARRPK